MHIKPKESLTFLEKIIDNPRLSIARKRGENGILVGNTAMMAAGVQSEFLAVNIAQAHALQSAIILRSGEPPQYNKQRSPKSGINLTKTSKQGFFKGALSQELRFSRLNNEQNPLPHHDKDTEHLALPITHPDYQHVMRLDINMLDILREVSPQGDLKVLGFNINTGMLRLEYRKNKGPRTDYIPPLGFNGQFIIHLYEGHYVPQYYSREWDAPEYHSDWDANQQIIKKPLALSEIPDNIYQQFFKCQFYVHYSETKTANPLPKEIYSAKVFANRPRSAIEFKAAMGSSHPYFNVIESQKNLADILTTLVTLLPKDAEDVILEVYNKGGRIVAGDWDGMALGHPPDLNPLYAKEINTLSPGIEGLENQALLIDRTDHYLYELKEAALKKQVDGHSLLPFEEKILSISSITAIVSDFCLARAGCITPHEFLFQQILNDAYRDELNSHYGDRYDNSVVQQVMKKLLFASGNFSSAEQFDITCQLLKVEFAASNYHSLDGRVISGGMINKLATHIVNQLLVVKQDNLDTFILPHVSHDLNVHDLYQHGFDMRNPYDANLEGNWLLINSDGTVLFGENEEQLIEVLLTDDFLESNRIDINHAADMSAGWSRVITKQLALGQAIPAKTLVNYETFQAKKMKHYFLGLKSKGAGTSSNEETQQNAPYSPFTTR